VEGLGRRVRERAALVPVLWRASRPLTVAAVLSALLAGVLNPIFTLTSGALVTAVTEALDDGVRRPTGTIVGLLVLAAVVYVVSLVMGPVREAAGDALLRRVDEHLALRVMEGVLEPRGVAHLEDADVLDRIAQSLGAVTAITPGMAAYYVIQLWSSRLQALLSLAIVVAYSPWWALALLVAHVVGYRTRRWHFEEVTNVLHSATPVLRRSHYLRQLATDGDAAKETRIFGLGDWLVDRYHTTALETLEPIWRKRRNGGLVALAVTAALLALEGLLLADIVRSAVAGDLGLGAAVVYAQAVVAASNLGVFNDAHLYVTEGTKALGVLRELERSVPTAGAHLGGSAPADGLPQRTIAFEGVTFRYGGQAEDVFTGLDLEIEAGTSLAIVGENGAGKTTFVKLLSRLYDPTGGRITVDGVDLRSLDPAAWQRRVAAVFQDYVSYKVSAHDNVAFGAVEALADRAGVVAAAERAGASAAVDVLERGWDTPLSREFTGGTDLSGGEWQRLALARALFAIGHGAGVLILDEPTASLDVRGEAAVYERFLEMTRGVTTIVISHRFSTVRRADRIVVLEHGRIVEDGTHDSLLAAGGRYAEMYRLQAARFGDG
jgi:ATP-binding cassette, subfamily B, bacterial